MSNDGFNFGSSIVLIILLFIFIIIGAEIVDGLLRWLLI